MKKVGAHRHKDSRVNIPTEELRDFVAEDEARPGTMLYPRDPSLDPQLVWKGKDEQDRHDLAVPVVPIYIQEKIHPQAIIEDLRKSAQWSVDSKAGNGDDSLSSPSSLTTRHSSQPDLFGDFNGLPDDFERRIDFYNHDTPDKPHWSNRMILGDSLMVMTSLAEKEGLRGKVQTIYLDPPYGIKFGSNWQVSTKKRDVKDGKAEDLTRQPEQVRAFRDTWKLGIHSYLAYLRDRLAAARELLTESGSIFVQIGDENVHLVRCILDEIFGVENFCSSIAFSKTAGLGADLLPASYDILLWYSKNREHVKYRNVYLEKGRDDQSRLLYRWLIDEFGELQGGNHASRQDSGELARIDNLSAMFTTPHLALRYQYRGRGFLPPQGRQWQTTQEGLRRLESANRLCISGSSLAYIRFIRDFPVSLLNNSWRDTGTGSFTEQKVYVG